MVWERLPVYFFKPHETFYLSSSIPSDRRYLLNKRKIKVPLRTKSETIADKSAAALSDRLESYWNRLRMHAIYSQEVDIKALENSTKAQTSYHRQLSALKLFHRLKGLGKSRLFFEVSTRRIRYIEDCLGHDYLLAVKPLDACRFRDSLFQRETTSSSVKRVFSSISAILN